MKIYTKICASTLFVVFFAYTLATAPAFAITTTSNGSTSAPGTESNGSTSAPATVSNGSTSSTPAPAPATVSNGSTSAPATVSNGTTSDKPAPATVSNGSTSGSPVTPPTTPQTPPSNNTGPISTGGGGCVSGCTSSGSGFISNPIAISANPTCSYLNSYLTVGSQNNSLEVVKLQNFLKNIEKINVDVNGIFDQKTIDAVKTFQAKYANETLTPWGITTPTGQVFYTTKKKINEVYCKSVVSLTAGELAGIEAYKNSVKDGIVQTENTSGTDSTGNVVGSNGSTTGSQTAGAADTSIAGKIWNFVKWLFGY